MKIKTTTFYNRLQCIPDGSSESEWSDDDDLYTSV